MKPVSREARVDGCKDWPNWMPMGNVTMAEAARRMAQWKYNFSKVKKLPKTLRVLVRDHDGSGKEFPFDVEVKIQINVKSLRGED